MTVDCIMHVGAGKCGSSSLQAYLSQNPRLTSHDGKQYEYMCLKDNSRVLHGSRCRQATARNAYGYASSVSVSRFFSPDYPTLRGRIERLAGERRIPVFSYEGWISEVRLFEEWRVLEKLDLRAKVIMFVRPQVDWINSSWWQWGAWTNRSFTDWLNRWKHKGLWAKAGNLWRQAPGVAEVTICTTAEDVVTSFLRSVNAPLPAQHIKRNASLDGNMLRFLQQHPELRAGRRQSAMHMMLDRSLSGSPVPAPWVLKPEMIAQLVEFYRRDNRRLIELVDEKTGAEMSADPRWWQASAYDEKQGEEPEPVPLSLDQLDDVAVRAVQAILALDDRLRGK